MLMLYLGGRAATGRSLVGGTLGMLECQGWRSMLALVDVPLTWKFHCALTVHRLFRLLWHPSIKCVTFWIIAQGRLKIDRNEDQKNVFF